MDVGHWLVELILVAVAGPLLVLCVRYLQSAARDTHANALAINRMAEELERHRNDFDAFEDRCDRLRESCPVTGLGGTVSRHAERLDAIALIQNRDREDLRAHIAANREDHRRIYELLEKIYRGVNGGSDDG